MGLTDLFAAPPNVIELPDNDEDVALRPRKNKKLAAGKTSQPGLMMEPIVQQPEDAGGASVTFAVPLSSERPASSTVPVFSSAVQLHASELQAAASAPSILFFTTHHVPESHADAAAEAICQAGIMMEQVKVVHEASQAGYNASSALHVNVKVS